MDSDHNVRFVYDKLTNHIGGEEKRTLTVTVEKNTAEAYNVTFVWNVDSLLGGDFSDVVYREVTVSAQDACLGADMPAAPVYYNQAFEGWNTHRDGKGIEVTANTPITQDMTLYGQWSTAEIISEYHVMGLTSIKRVVKDNAGLDTLILPSRAFRPPMVRTIPLRTSATSTWRSGIAGMCTTISNLSVLRRSRASRLPSR